MRIGFLLLLVSGIGLIAVRLYRKTQHNKYGIFTETIEKAGIPDQMDVETAAQLENANMVSEGSQFGVHYYNEIAEELDK